MPRQGDGSSDNGPMLKDEHAIVHGQGDNQPDQHVARADKTASMPEPEKGMGLEDANASGGQSQGIKKGPDVGQGGSNTN